MNTPEPQNSPNTSSDLSSEASLPNQPNQAGLPSIDNEQIQVSFLLGHLESNPQMTAEQNKIHSKKVNSRFRLLVSNAGGQFFELPDQSFYYVLGINNPTEEDPLNAVTYGLKFLRLSTLSNPLLSLQCAIATGLVPQSAFLSQELEVEHLEVAQRAQKLLQSSPFGSLFVDHLTYHMTRNYLRFNKVQKEEWKLSSLTAYEVLSEKNNESLPLVELIGREKEIQMLKNAFDQICRLKGPCYQVVTGDHGIGKTAVVSDFLQSVVGKACVLKNPKERRRMDRWRRVPFSYFSEMFRAFFSISMHEQPLQAVRKLNQNLRAIFEPIDASILDELVRVLSHVCQIPLLEEEHLLESPQSISETQIFSGMIRFLELLAQKTPVLFVLDDLFSADASSLRLLNFLYQNLFSPSILVISISRFSLLKELEVESGFVPIGDVIHLQPLKEMDSKKLLESILPENTKLPTNLLQRILNIANGNPLFLKETVNEIRENMDSLDDTSELKKLELPGNIEGILLARLSRLSAKEKDFLRLASVFGRRFWLGGIEMLHRQINELEICWEIPVEEAENKGHLHGVLEKLVFQGIVVFHEDSLFEGESQFSFVSGLLQELLYKEISVEHALQYHGLAAQWLKMMQNRKGVEVDSEIAFQFECAGENNQAGKHYIRSGILCFKIGETQQAVEFLGKGIALLGETESVRKMSAFRHLSEAFISNGQYNQAIEIFEQILPLAWKMGNKILAGEVFARKGWTLFLARNFQESLEHLEIAQQLHKDNHYPRGIGMTLSHMGKVYTVLGDYEKAEKLLREALSIRKTLDNQGDISWTQNDLANLLLDTGRPLEALQLHKEALQIRESLGNLQMTLQSTNNIAAINMMLGNDEEALVQFVQSVELAKKSGEKLTLSIVYVNLGEVYLLRGETQEAQKYIHLAIDIASRLQDKLILSECARLSSEVYLEEGAIQKALESSEYAFHLIKECGIRSSLAAIYRLMGEVYSVVSQEALLLHSKKSNTIHLIPSFLYGNAVACFEESISVAKQGGNPREEAKSRMILGLYEVNNHRRDRGLVHLAKARNTFTELGMERYRIDVSRIIDDIVQNTSQAGVQLYDSFSQLPQMRERHSSLSEVEKTQPIQSPVLIEEFLPSSKNSLKGTGSSDEMVLNEDDLSFLDEEFSMDDTSSFHSSQDLASLDVGEINRSPGSKQASVYDSQVIIAQMSGNDNVSLDWFEKGRSANVDRFWKEKAEEAQQIKDEIEVEQIAEEIDRLDRKKNK